MQSCDCKCTFFNIGKVQLEQDKCMTGLRVALLMCARREKHSGGKNKQHRILRGVFQKQNDWMMHRSLPEGRTLMWSSSLFCSPPPTPLQTRHLLHHSVGWCNKFNSIHSRKSHFLKAQLPPLGSRDGTSVSPGRRAWLGSEGRWD